jgi:hypothetical protein
MAQRRNNSSGLGLLLVRFGTEFIRSNVLGRIVPFNKHFAEELLSKNDMDREEVFCFPTECADGFAYVGCTCM